MRLKRRNMMGYIVPEILVAAALFGGGYLLAKHTGAAAPPATPVNPNVNPNLPPVPNPNALTPAQLLAQATALATQAALNPNSVDPAQLDAYAAQLDQVGYPTQAANIRQVAAQVRVLRGLPPSGT